jgi:threonine dehydrogenase-like Zn-dependent dehydrogenase
MGDITMKRVTKPAGQFNIVLENVAVPEPGPHEIRVRSVRSLISRGSELWHRYIKHEAVDPNIMGYSVGGTVDAVGSEVTRFVPGDRVAISAPHAEYVIGNTHSHEYAEGTGPQVVALPDDVSFDQATFWPLTTSAVQWVELDDISPDHTVVILGQGLVGSLMLQVARANGDGRLIAVDVLPMRCNLASALGANIVVNASTEDPLSRVLEITDGVGADVVVYAVGGRDGLDAFAQAQQMVARGGLIHVVGKYEDAPLPLSSSHIQQKRLIGGTLPDSDRQQASERALGLLADGHIATDRMITHRFAYLEAAAAFRFLHDCPAEAFGVLLTWEADTPDI